MKRKLFPYFLLIALSLSFSPNFLFGQQWYYFDGFITDIDNGSPVTAHPVFLANGDSLVGGMTFTDEFGYYFDSLFIVGQGDALRAVVSTFDCMGEEHSFVYYQLDSSNRHNFEVCTQVSGCQAYFYYEANQQNPFLLHFTDFSEGDIETWTWDFGDGSSSSEQNPSHIYNTSGVFQVCLTIENSLDSCYNVFCEDVYVGQSDCEADFEWQASVENPLEINFTDLSNGDIAFWDWDFGDGIFSEEQSPVHQYAVPGEYWVSLFVADTLGICFDEISKLIYVYSDTMDCKAAFNYSLDTLNNTPNVYFFQDASEGNIEEWFWEFGDGQTSNEQYPQHTYEEGGTYEVCLNISSSPPNGGDCFDRTCQTIETPNYFNFGGQVFIDGFTINIDSTDDENIAMAYLYRRVDNKWWYMDEREFWKYGYYWFVDKPEGEYLVRADLLEGSLDYDNYTPSYYKESVNWQYANTFYLSNDEQFAVNIDLKKLAPLQSGIGSLSGYLEPGIGCSYSIQMENQLVHLFNTENQIVAFTYTDENGYFGFNGLAFGQFRVRAEFTGNSSTYFDANLDGVNPIISDIELVIDCNSFVGVDEYISENSITIESIFPIPAVNYINLMVNSKESKKAIIIIYDLNGQAVVEKSVSLNQGSQQFTIPVSSLNSGLYLLNLLSEDGKSITHQKIIINN